MFFGLPRFGLPWVFQNSRLTLFLLISCAICMALPALNMDLKFTVSSLVVVLGVSNWCGLQRPIPHFSPAWDWSSLSQDWLSDRAEVFLSRFSFPWPQGSSCYLKAPLFSSSLWKHCITRVTMRMWNSRLGDRACLRRWVFIGNANALQLHRILSRIDFLLHL